MTERGEGPAQHVLGLLRQLAFEPGQSGFNQLAVSDLIAF